MKLRILFISHSYPPILGGVESQNFNLAESLSKIAEVKIIANKYGKIWLPVFIPLAFFQAVFLMAFCDACLMGNGILAPLAAALKIFHAKKKFFSVVHALDITFATKPGFLPGIYKSLNIPSLKKLDKLFMVGNFTIEEAVRVGIPRSSCVFIPNGVPIDKLKNNCERNDLSELFGLETKDKKVILRLGRFVPHKGTDWFIRKVMPKLPPEIILIAVGHRVAKNTVGDRDNYPDCEKAVKDNHLESRVKLLPDFPQRDLEILLNTADLVVAPNIKIQGSSEGFGINVIEAGICGRIVIASNLEGLADAIKDGQNGFLVEPGNAEQWANKILSIFEAGPEFAEKFGASASRFVEENYSWEKISKKYLEEMEKVINN
jgi:glycosyltransferase involved in cell wall biosynthesis